jgi:ribosome-binding protein aMBF1 (putative translation factor)
MEKRIRQARLPSSEELSHRLDFSAKVRAARAVLGWSQTYLGQRAKLSQRAIHRIEQAAVQVRRSSALAIQAAFDGTGIRFVELNDGGFALTVPRTALAAAQETLSPPRRSRRPARPSARPA